MILARRSILTLVATLALVSGVSRAQVIKQVPGGALAVFKVSNLQAVDTKLANLFQQLGVVQLNPDMADPLLYLEKQSGVNAGLNVNGDLAVAIFDPASFTSPEAKADPTLGLIPVSDYKAFLTNFPDAKNADGVDTFTTKDGKTMYSTQWGDFAAVASTKEALSLKPGGLEVGPMAQKEFDSKDFVLFANMKVLRPNLTAQLTGQEDKIYSSIKDKMMQNEKSAKYYPLAKTAIAQLLKVATTFLRDADSATESANIGPDGIGTTVLADYAADSYMGKLTANLKQSDASFLTGLPTNKYLFFGGSTVDPKVVSQVVADLTDPIAAELTNLGDDGKPFVDYLNNFKTAIGASTGDTFAIPTPTGALGQDPLLQVISIKHGDAATMADAYAKLNAQQNQIMQAFNAANGATITVTPKAKVVDDITFDQVQTQFNPDPNDPQQQQAAQMASMMYGPNGFNMFIGQVNDKNLLAISGLSDDGIKTVIESIKSDDDSMSKDPMVQQVAAQLPATRAAAVYVPLDELVKSAMNYAQQFGFRAGVAPPPAVPPIGWTFSTDNTAMRVDMYIPSQLMQTLTSMGIQVYTKMHQNQAGGQGGL
jgi:hypothetical protein